MTFIKGHKKKLSVTVQFGLFVNDKKLSIFITQK